MFSMFKRKNDKATEEYEAVIAQSRNPVLYNDYNVPDNPHGRFQMIALHASPYFIKHGKAGEGKESQYLFDLIFKDIELSFREIGVGDLGVPKKMKRYMQDFNGIIQGHAAANADHVDITRRNVFGENTSKDFFNNDTRVFKNIKIGSYQIQQTYRAG